MKKFEELEIIVRRIDTNKEARITLPNIDPIDELEIALMTDEENEDMGEYIIDEDELEIVEIEDTSGLFNKFSSSKNIGIDELNSIAEKLAEFDEDEERKILAINEALGLKLEELLDIDVNNYYLYEDATAEDYYYSRVEDGLYGEIPDNLMVCIDFEKFAKYERINENVYETEYGVLVS